MSTEEAKQVTPISPVQRPRGTSMKELIEYIAKSIVNKPEEVVVTEERESDRVVLKLSCAQDDMGRVIGKQGRVAQAMRTLLRVMAVREGVKANLEIV